MIESNVDIEFLGNAEVRLMFSVATEDALKVLKDGLSYKRVSQVYVKLGYPRKPRTTGKGSGSAHFHGHCQQICQHTGDDFDDVKMHIKRMAIKRGYPTHEDSFGTVVPDSESSISTVQESMLIDTAHEVASFLNVRLKEYDDE